MNINTHQHRHGAGVGHAHPRTSTGPGGSSAGFARLFAAIVACLLLAPTPEAAGQSKSQNAKDLRQWSLKSGAGAPHNILPVPEVSRREEATFLRMPRLSPEYVLGEGDRLDIRVVDGGALNDALRALTVSNTGEITLPYVGSVQAAGLTASQLEETVARLLEDRQLIKQPAVLVYVTDYRAKPIYIMGQVDNPGEYMMSQELTLMEGILMAGGIDPGAGSFAYLHRRKAPGGPAPQVDRVLEQPTLAEPNTEIITIDLRPLKKGGVPEPDVVLRKGDLLVIPTSADRRFYVLGDVRSPGSKEIPPPPERPLTVAQAIAQAGGPNKTAKLSEGLLVRYSEKDGSREQHKVDFFAILRGDQPDIPILPNDIIFIPGSNAKTVAYGMLRQLPSTAQQKAGEVIK
jgi:polysaccharide export outer membrane protein